VGVRPVQHVWHDVVQGGLDWIGYRAATQIRMCSPTCSDRIAALSSNSIYLYVVSCQWLESFKEASHNYLKSPVFHTLGRPQIAAELNA